MGILEKYGTALMAIMLGGGFAFGGMSAYSSMVNADSGGGGGEANLSAPAQNFNQGEINRTSQEKLYIAAQNDYIFVTAYYMNESEREALGNLESLPSDFNDRAYINVVNASEIVPPGEITDYPAALVFGANRASPSVVVQDATESKIRQAMCDSVGNLGELAATCVG